MRYEEACYNFLTNGSKRSSGSDAIDSKTSSCKNRNTIYLLLTYLKIHSQSKQLKTDIHKYLHSGRRGTCKRVRQGVRAAGSVRHAARGQLAARRQRPRRAGIIPGSGSSGGGTGRARERAPTGRSGGDGGPRRLPPPAAPALAGSPRLRQRPLTLREAGATLIG